ncbi:hypothetical protein [Neptuniibacter sp.]|uniref:hypothetical protein n=1 Tax=Neptuniibacter sp. TaxID=1962643 RepID=UPI00260DA294|nr:hypothetical protein [Neptuniibacter sp.]MCP4596557.1 hypothetical protein [Neptuniibacter sp.]
MNGSGTSNDPYIITTIYDLQSLDGDAGGLYYELGNDIDATDTRYWNGGLGFKPISSSGESYWWGHLGGKGYTIEGIYSSYQQVLGIFSQLAYYDGGGPPP